MSHILIIPSWYKSPKNPITGTFFEEQARMLQKKGHQVGIIFPYHQIRFLGISRFNEETTPPKVLDQDIPTFYSFTESIVPKKSSPTILDQWVCTKAGMGVFNKYVEEYGKPDLIHAHSTLWGGVLANRIAKNTQIPYFLTKHFSGWVLPGSHRPSSFLQKALKKVVRGSQKVFVVSSSYRNQLIKLYSLDEKKLTVIPNLCNPIFFENRSKISMAIPVRLIVVANLKIEKNHITLFRAIDILIKRNHKVFLTVVGDGWYKKTLQKFVKDNGLSKYIIFKGALTRKMVLEELNQSHILVSASYFETFGVNIIEALAVGRPVVALNSGGPADILNSFNGILLEENTPFAFAEAIQKIIIDYDRFSPEKISNDCLNRFGENVVYEKLFQHYKSVLPTI